MELTSDSSLSCTLACASNCAIPAQRFSVVSVVREVRLRRGGFGVGPDIWLQSVMQFACSPPSRPVCVLSQP